MNAKTTEELRHELKAATNIEDYLRSNQKNLVRYNLPEYLRSLLSCKKLRKIGRAHV